MKKYLEAAAKPDDRDFVSCMDELPLWSAPFGLSLLEKIHLKAGLRVLDVGCGLGFPLLEIAQRLGNSCRVTGIDPWKTALERIRMKIAQGGLSNVQLVNGTAESMPFEDAAFNLIVSNNGLNNVQDLEQAIKECGRVTAPGAQMVITQNLDGTMTEFYSRFEKVLAEMGCVAEIAALKNHIYQKRRPVEEVTGILETNGFHIRSADERQFTLRFLDAGAFFNHTFIRYWFCGSWKEIAGEQLQEPIFTALENELNRLAEKQGELKMSIPYVIIDAEKRKEE